MPVRQLIETRYGSSELGEEEVPGNVTINAILGRASCRQFDPEPVPEPLLQTLLAAAFSAPSKSDLQQRTVILIRDRDKQLRIAALSEALEWVGEAPLFMVWCGDNRRIRQVSDWRGHAFANDHLDTFMNAAVDAAIAMQTFIIAAESAGLGCCPVSQIRDQVEALSRELKLPDYVFPVAGLCVGWPGELPGVSPRLPLSLTVHEDQYTEPETLPETIAEYDRRRESISPTTAADQRMVDRFGISGDYGWSENRSRQAAVPARTDFGRYIRNQKFNLE